MTRRIGFPMLRCVEIAFLVNVFVFLTCATGYSTLLTFNSKSVVTSTTAVTTTSSTLQDDGQASQTFTLTGSKTALVIYQANNVVASSMYYTGMQNAISVDGTDYAKSWDSAFDDNYIARNTVFWIGTLASGSHTIKGRFASNTNGQTVTINNRLLLIYILDGTEFQYVESTTTATSNSTTLGNDTPALLTFTPSGACKALVLYNIANSGATESSFGKSAAISISGGGTCTNCSQAEQSPATDNYADSVFTTWALSLSASATTVQGRWASLYSTATIHRRQLGVLMFADSTLLDTISSNTLASTSSSTLSNDAQATITRTTADSRELLVVAMGTKRDGVAEADFSGSRYGISVDGSSKTASRTSLGNTWRAGSAATAWAQTMSAAAHTVRGQLSNNNSTDSARIESRRVAALWLSTTATAVSLVSFKAAGDDGNIRVSWTTGQEISNLGFHVYRGESVGGPFTRLTESRIPGMSFSEGQRDYSYVDRDVTRGRIYYYKLEDIDASGTSTMHGPVCVDWDGDGIADDWEIANGLNQAVNDAALDSDGDGAQNLLEYQRGTDPFNPDTDGDGVLDGAEKKNPGYAGGVTNLGADASVQVLASDSRGMTLELTTQGFDVTPVTAGGQAFERLRVPGYVHGYTQAAGLPQVPLKGVLLDVPSGKQTRVEVLDATSRVLAGYRVYPAPLYQAGENQQVTEVFSWDEAAYQENAYYPAVAAELSTEYVYRGHAKQRLVLYPLRFNPGTGELLYYERLRVRVAYVEAAAAGGLLRDAAAVHRAPSAATGWSIPAGAAYKVSTAGEGIYRITRDWLTAQGIGPTEIDAIDLSRVQLFNIGAEQAIHVYDQNADNRLDAGDTISFYATAVPAAYAKYARYNVYWLIDAGSASPLRMASVNGAPAGAPLADSHQSTVHYELDKGYLQNSPGPDGMDRWLFPAVALGSGFAGGGAAKSFTLTLTGVAGEGELAVRLYSPFNMDHSAAVSLNNSSLGSATWSGPGFTEARFAGVSLLEGDNTIAITCETSTDKIYFDWFEADYKRSFAAAAGSLKFTHAGGFRYAISGFGTDDAELFDISDTSAVKRVVNGTTAGSGPYSIEVEPAGATGSPSYLAVAAVGRKTPAAIVKDTASSLASSTNAADWILITHREIGWDGNGAQQNWVASLVGLRHSQGLRTAVVDAADIFDEFGYGLVSPEAIKDFITYAYESWQTPAPQYVLLMGDTTYDYKDNWGLGTVNYLPGYLIYTNYLGETISDDWYVQVSGADAVPDLYIGRLPANSAAQAADMVAKIVAYETSANAKLWEKSVLLVADNVVEEWESVFETMNENAAAFLPAGMAGPDRFYLQEYENESLAVDDLTADLKAAINAGALMLNYSGHSNHNVWADEGIIDNSGYALRSDVTSLANTGMYPFVVNMTCLTGYFIYPAAGGWAGSGGLSLAEGFMLPATHGAIAALMPTAMTDTAGQHVLSDALYEAIFSQDQRILGAAVVAAKQTLLANGGAAYEETSNTFQFFGDPATSLKVPLPRRPQALAAQWQAGGRVALSWAAALDCDGHAVSGYNLYRRLSSEDSYTKLNTAPITALTYTDTGLSGAPVGATYYYVLSAVDSASDESVKSAPAALTIADSGDGGGGGGGRWCFISAAGLDLSPDLLKPFGVMALLGCLIWISRRRRGGKRAPRRRLEGMEDRRFAP
jgi:hypothetical protein